MNCCFLIGGDIQTLINFYTLQKIDYKTWLYIQGHHGEFEPSNAQYSTPNVFDQLFLIRAYWNPKSWSLALPAVAPLIFTRQQNGVIMRLRRQKNNKKKNSLCLDNRQNIHPIPNHKIYPIRFERHQGSSSRVRLIHFWRCRHRLACPKRESTWQMNVRSVWQNYVP